MTDTPVYREHLPPPELRDVVRCAWELTGDAEAGDFEPIVPDGCPELVFNLADPYRRRSRTGAHLQPRAMVVGQTTEAAWVGPSGVSTLVGLRLHPWGGPVLFGVPMSELIDAFVPGADVLGRWVDDVHHHMGELPPPRRIDALFEAVHRRLAGRAGTSIPLARSVVRRIASSGGRVSVRALARAYGTSERTLQRLLHRDVGLAPSTLVRIVRVQDALGRMLARPEVPLGRLALDAGYYDQAHFTREFRRVVGCTPTDFLNGAPGLTSHFVAESGEP